MIKKIENWKIKKKKKQNRDITLAIIVNITKNFKKQKKKNLIEY